MWSAAMRTVSRAPARRLYIGVGFGLSSTVWTTRCGKGISMPSSAKRFSIWSRVSWAIFHWSKMSWIQAVALRLREQFKDIGGIGLKEAREPIRMTLTHMIYELQLDGPDMSDRRKADQ
jgi:hypothetical protein